MLIPPTAMDQMASSVARAPPQGHVGLFGSGGSVEATLRSEESQCGVQSLENSLTPGRTRTEGGRVAFRSATWVQNR
jgi:hypothetical protein